MAAGAAGGFMNTVIALIIAFVVAFAVVSSRRSRRNCSAQLHRLHGVRRCRGALVAHKIEELRLPHDHAVNFACSMRRDGTA